MSIFTEGKEFIVGNSKLYNAQIEAYQSARSHYLEFPNEEKYRESLIVMPTGSGKSGVIAMLPFNLSKKRVLIIAPGKIIREGLYSSLDSALNPHKTFWHQFEVLPTYSELPKTYLYKGYDAKDEQARSLLLQKFEAADIVITNIHKIVGSGEDKNLIELVSSDFFDLIIVDEAHHVAADMWQQAISYFNQAKIIKLTATPFRSDFKEITTHEYDPIFEYQLAEAIGDELLKDVVQEVEIADKLVFTHRDSGKPYSLIEARNEFGEDWVNRSVAYSKECSQQVINHSLETLALKRKDYEKHQILAVACNDEHAKDVAQWFNDAGMQATYVSTRSLSERDIEQRLKDFSNGLYDVMVSIQLLGEGYDNPNISIIALFRPYKTLGPYAQAIGRGLRRIRGENISDFSNYCNVVYHKELNLDSLWEYYKNQKKYSAMIKQRKEEMDAQLSFDFSELGFVESQPSGNISNPDAKEIDLANVTVEKTFAVGEYISDGIRPRSAFSSKGLERYTLLRIQLKEESEQRISDREQELQRLLEENTVDREEYDFLLAKAIKQETQPITALTHDYHDLLLAESMRKDFNNWLIQQIEVFFSISLLNRESFDINQNSNNIDTLTIQLRKGIFSEIKKKIGSFLPLDYHKAKEYTVDTIKYYEEKYGIEEE